MLYPEWARSYNALHVPLHPTTWNCALIPAREVQAVTWRWRFSDLESKNKKKEFERRLADDIDDFERYFSVDIETRERVGSSEFHSYFAFIRDHLRHLHWNTPTNGADIARILREAVRDGHVVPVVDRGQSSIHRPFKFYAPERWPVPQPHSATTTEVMSWRDFAVLKRANGVLPERNLPDSLPLETAFARHASDSEEDGLLLAARGVSEQDEDDCHFAYEMDMKGCAAGMAMYQSPAYYAVCAKKAFARYQTCRGF